MEAYNKKTLLIHNIFGYYPEVTLLLRLMVLSKEVRKYFEEMLPQLPAI